MRNVRLVLTLLAWPWGACAGTPFLERSWLSEDGLPGNFVRSVVQAADRYLWVATAEGVVRFDGVRFTEPAGEMARKINPFLPKSLYALPDGSVWIVMEGGGLVQWKDGVWKTLWPSQPEGGTADVTQVTAAVDGTVLIVRSGEVWQVKGTQEPLKSDPVPPAYVETLAADLASGRDRGRFTLHGPPPELLDSRNRRWIPGPARELLVRAPDGTSQTVLPPGSGVSSLTEDHEGNIWVALESGGLRRLRDRRVDMLDEDGEDNLAGAATCLLEDRSGAVWIGNRQGGIDRVEHGERHSMRLSGGGTQRAVCVLFEDSTGKLWAAARDGSLFVREGNGFPAFSDGPPLSKVNGMAEDGRGRLWIIGAYGLAVLQDGKVTSVAGPEAFQGRPATILITPEQDLWIGTSKGSVHRGNTQSLSLPALDAEGTKLAGGHRISALFQDSAAILWAATHGGGLLRFDAGAGWSSYGTDDGLPDLRLTAVTEDRSRHLWLGSLGGILRLPRSAIHSRVREEFLPWLRLDRSDGLSTRECTGNNQPSVLRTRDENLYFPTSRGVARVHQDVRLAALAPDPLIEWAQAGSVPWDPVTGPTVLLAGPGRTRLEFHFTVPSFAAPEKIRFRTRLRGLDEAWRESGPLRSMAYDAVPPGRYQFETAAMNGDGIPGKVATLAVEVKPHWWETLAFRIALGLAAGAAATGAGWWLARQRAQRRIARLQLRHAQENERARIARDLHDDLGASLTEISLLAALSAEEIPAGPHRQSLEDIASRTQHVVGTLDEIVWAVDPRHDTAASMVEYLSSWGQEFLGRAGITLRLDIPRDLTDFPMESDRRHALFLAVREAFHNIMKHSGAREAWLRMRSNEHTLTVIVEDTGSGFDSGAARRGHGLGNYHERMQTCGGTAQLTTAPGEGTRLEFQLPLPSGDPPRNGKTL